MDHFQYRDGQLHAEERPLGELAERFGTPLYVYSRAMLEQHYRAFDEAFGDHPHQICYAVKANANIAVLNVLARLGAGFDIVSGGELARVLRAGGDPAKVVFSGVGKTADEMEAALEAGIHCFNVESAAELELLNMVAGEQDKIAPISIRVNPDVDAQTHPYISTGLRDNKFGVDIDDAPALYQRAASLPHLEVLGVDCHIGSQLTSLAPFEDALARVLALVDKLAHRGITIRHLDLGGGLGVRYRDEAPPAPADYIQALLRHVPRGMPVHIEPGRSIAANAGVFLTQVLYLKPTPHKNFAIVDGAMNDLIRPSLYGAWQDIVPVAPHDADCREWDIVGPVCETGDFLGKERALALETGDLLAVRSAGAYGFAMASNYNTRNRPAEVMVDGNQAFLVRQRETIEEQLRLESLLP
ncbi:diaminopimelate decarboxylase [Isoalcanivorax indicus]|uniref:diaminopimelate decarboxylase n=1 Tax=Isoalcanivorax indicus TaxID=2202653 RepID=UPI000DBACA69|nr:diaminopimelate decarboxylase [Isoalcanivorax indicus]